MTNPQDWDDSYDSKEGIMINSGIISGLEVKEAIDRITNYIQKLGVGKRKTNYKLRDAIFSRQRYWGRAFSDILQKWYSLHTTRKRITAYVTGS